MKTSGLQARASSSRSWSQQRVGFCCPVQPVSHAARHLTARPRSQALYAPVVCSASAKDRIRVGGTTELEKLVKARVKPLIVDFYAPWCGPCVLQSKELVKVSEQLGSSVDILKIDTDHHPDLSRQLQIKGLPTIIIVPTDTSKPAFRTEGLFSASKIIDIVAAEERQSTAVNGARKVRKRAAA